VTKTEATQSICGGGSINSSGGEKQKENARSG
jgi:hypothetical protein